MPEESRHIYVAARLDQGLAGEVEPLKCSRINKIDGWSVNLWFKVSMDASCRASIISMLSVL